MRADYPPAIAVQAPLDLELLVWLILQDPKQHQTAADLLFVIKQKDKFAFRRVGCEMLKQFLGRGFLDFLELLR